jgi:phosphatidylinositol glycan class T
MSYVALSFIHARFLISGIFLLVDANKAAFLRRILDKFRGRSSESTQPQQPSSSSSSSSFITPKLFLKVLLVAGIAVIWQYYLK